MATLTRQALKDLINKEGQTLTLTKNYNVYTIPSEGQYLHSELTFEGDYARFDITDNPELGQALEVAELRGAYFRLWTINKQGKRVKSHVDYPTKGNAILEGKTLTLKGGWPFRVGSVVTHLIYTVAII